MNQKLKDELYKRIQSGKLYTDVDLHVHSTFSDGCNSSEEMILSAIDKGIKILGFSEHSRLHGEGWCMTEKDETEYRQCIKKLKTKYKDKIDIYCGIEQDALSQPADTFYDYVIGSNHGVAAGNKVLWVDASYDEIKKVVKDHYNNDFYAYAEAYYDDIANVSTNTKCDIVGHIDLITKFNEDGSMFDLSHPRYIRAWKHAVDSLTGKGLIFEINTGAISRGYRTIPYPSIDMIRYLKEKGESMILSSDSHAAKTIAFEFDKWKTIL